MAATFSASLTEQIARALGHTTEGLTGPEMSLVLQGLRLPDPDPGETKWIRLHNAFVADQNARGDRTGVLAFIRRAMRPERFAEDRGRYEELRARLNRALAFDGLAVEATGNLILAAKAGTIGEAERMARELGDTMASRGVHPDVLRFCRAELMGGDYFHAVLEAVKSVAEKLRARTGLMMDGAVLVDRALTGSPPMLAINSLATDNDRGEQAGFANLVKGTFGMFRNPTAHVPRVHWPMGKEDAEDLLSLVSLMHRRLDVARMPPRT